MRWPWQKPLRLEPVVIPPTSGRAPEKPLQFTYLVSAQAVLYLDEDEMGALDALVGYGADSFLKVFYEHMGKSYMQPHEKGLRRLFSKISNTVPQALSDARTARQLLQERNKR